MNNSLQLSPRGGSLSNMSTANRFLTPSTSTAVPYDRDLVSPCSSEENNSPTALNSFNWDKPALEDKSVEFGWSSQNRNNSSSPTTEPDSGDRRQTDGLWNTGYVDLDVKHCSANERVSFASELPGYIPRKENELMQRCSTCHNDSPKHSFSQESADHPFRMEAHDPHYRDAKTSVLRTSDSFMMSPPTPTESKEDLVIRFRKEQEGLKKVPWFQAGIPREIALEVLSGKPVGSFIVRESTTKPGCYALSLRVPPEKNPSGIAHYLILHTNKGYKIKGFIKEFGSLDALITHHSLMPELLPCTLALPRREQERHSSRRDDDMDFVATDQNDRCPVFSDIHWLMNDLEL